MNLVRAIRIINGQSPAYSHASVYGGAESDAHGDAARIPDFFRAPAEVCFHHFHTDAANCAPRVACPEPALAFEVSGWTERMTAGKTAGVVATPGEIGARGNACLLAPTTRPDRQACIRIAVTAGETAPLSTSRACGMPCRTASGVNQKKGTESVDGSGLLWVLWQGMTGRKDGRAQATRDVTAGSDSGPAGPSCPPDRQGSLCTAVTARRDGQPLCTRRGAEMAAGKTARDGYVDCWISQRGGHIGSDRPPRPTGDNPTCGDSAERRACEGNTVFGERPQGRASLADLPRETDGGHVGKAVTAWRDTHPVAGAGAEPGSGMNTLGRCGGVTIDPADSEHAGGRAPNSAFSPIAGWSSWQLAGAYPGRRRFDSGSRTFFRPSGRRSDPRRMDAAGARRWLATPDPRFFPHSQAARGPQRSTRLERPASSGQVAGGGELDPHLLSAEWREPAGRHPEHTERGFRTSCSYVLFKCGADCLPGRGHTGKTVGKRVRGRGFFIFPDLSCAERPRASTDRDAPFRNAD